jgi:hypothetical protein
MPASLSPARFSMAATVVSTARQWSLPSRSWLAAAASSSECLAALQHLGVGHPAAVPDQRVLLVVATPHERVVNRGDGIHAAADQRGEHRAGIPGRRAHPGEVAARADQDAAFAVGEQRVLAQHLQRELGGASRFLVRHGGEPSSYMPAALA